MNPHKFKGCIYKATTKVPWRTKVRQSNSIKTVMAPVQCASVDQLESTLPWLLAQLKGILAKQSYISATVFVDHFSRLGYLHLHNNLTSEETSKANQYFESYSWKQRLIIRNYHVDNGRFSEKLLVNLVNAQGQKISYFRVNTHFQNIIA